MCRWTACFFMPDLSSVHIDGGAKLGTVRNKAPKDYKSTGVRGVVSRTKTGNTPGGRQYGTVSMLNLNTGEKRQNTKVVSKGEGKAKGSFDVHKEYGKTTRNGKSAKISLTQRGKNVSAKFEPGPGAASKAPKKTRGSKSK